MALFSGKIRKIAHTFSLTNVLPEKANVITSRCYICCLTTHIILCLPEYVCISITYTYLCMCRACVRYVKKYLLYRV
jgi:hypothetical protein